MKLALTVAAAVVVLALAVFFGWREVSAPATTRVLTPAPSEHRAEPSAIAPSQPASFASEPASEQRAVVDGPVAPPKPTRWTPTLLRVRVVSTERGEPVADEQVALIDASSPSSNVEPIGQWHGKPGQAPATNAEGLVEFAVEPGIAYRVWWARDLQPTNAIDVPALIENEVREVSLSVATTPDLLIHGHVVDIDTRQPIAGATVRFDLQRGYALQPGRQLDVGSDGTFELRACSWLWYEWKASAPGYAPETFNLMPGELIGVDEFPMHLRLSRAAALEVVVRDAKQQPLRARIALSSDSDDHWEATSEVDGRASFAELPAKTPLELSVRVGDADPRVEPEPIRLVAGETQRVELVLGAGATIRGRLEDLTGSSVAGVEIVRVLDAKALPRLIGATDHVLARTHTDEHGQFSFDDVQAGHWLVGVPTPQAVMNAILPPWRHQPIAELVDELACCLAQPVTVESNSTDIAVALRVERTGYLRGSVTDPGGAPVPDCTVRAHLQNGALSIYRVTDERGAFAIGPAPPGTYAVAADASGEALTDSESVVARVGESNIALRLRAGATLGGRVVDASGASPACNLLVCRAGLGSGNIELIASDGSWSVSGRAPGIYDVYARSKDGSWARAKGIELRDGATRDDLELVLQAGAHLRVRCDGCDSHMRGELLVDGNSIGNFAFGHSDDPRQATLPAGAYELRWLDGDDELVHSQKFTLAAGDEREIAWNGRP